MKRNLNFYSAYKVKAPYPIIKVENFIDKKSCRKLCAEIEKFSDFDDLVMNGRWRVNKGSINFEKNLKKSPYLFSLFNKLNSNKIFVNMNNLLNSKFHKSSWKIKLNNYNFSKSNFSEQKFSIFKILSRSKLISNFFTPKIFMDMDFSKSERGYFRRAHTDRDSRVLNFLIYLNTIDKKDGGQFQIFDLKKKNIQVLKRFPDPKSLIKIKSFPPKSGQLFFFLSTPNSYHGVSKFLSNIKNRIFIYGSYSMDRKANWVKKIN